MKPQLRFVVAFFVSLLVVVQLMLLAAAVKPELFNLLGDVSPGKPQPRTPSSEPKVHEPLAQASDTLRSNLSQRLASQTAQRSIIESAKSEGRDSRTYLDSLAALTVQLEQERRTIVDLKKKLQEKSIVPDSGKSKSTKTIAKLLEAMSAEDAARILRNMEEKDVKAILAVVNKRQAGKILAALEPDRAARILK